MYIYADCYILSHIKLKLKQRVLITTHKNRSEAIEFGLYTCFCKRAKTNKVIPD